MRRARRRRRAVREREGASPAALGARERGGETFRFFSSFCSLLLRQRGESFFSSAAEVLFFAAA
jgi:hypothetical protein